MSARDSGASMRVAAQLVRDIATALVAAADSWDKLAAAEDEKVTLASAPMSLREFCDFAGISEGTFHRYRREGTAPTVTRVANRIRIMHDDANAWLEARREAKRTPKGKRLHYMPGGGVSRFTAPPGAKGLKFKRP